MFPAVRVPFLRFPPFSCFSASCVLSFTQPCGSSPVGRPSLAPCCLPSTSVGPGVEQLLSPCLWSALSEAAALQGGSDRRRARVVARAVSWHVPVSWRRCPGGDQAAELGRPHAGPQTVSHHGFSTTSWTCVVEAAWTEPCRAGVDVRGPSRSLVHSPF